MSDHITEAAKAMHASDCGCKDWDCGGQDVYYIGLAEAAAPTLIQHGYTQGYKAGAADVGRDFRRAVTDFTEVVDIIAGDA